MILVKTLTFLQWRNSTKRVFFPVSGRERRYRFQNAAIGPPRDVDQGLEPAEWGTCKLNEVQTACSLTIRIAMPSERKVRSWVA